MVLGLITMISRALHLAPVFVLGCSLVMGFLPLGLGGTSGTKVILELGCIPKTKMP